MKKTILTIHYVSFPQLLSFYYLTYVAYSTIFTGRQDSMVIGIIGYLKSGKDTVADFIINKTLTTHNFKKYSFAGPLKEATKVLFGWDDDMVHDQSKKEQVDPTWGISPRQALQVLGTDIMREWFPNKFPGFQEVVGSNFWVNKFIKHVNDNHGSNLICADVRFANEILAIKKLGGIIVRVHRDSVVPTGGEVHPSENVGVLQHFVDVNIYNNASIDDLWNSVGLFVDVNICSPKTTGVLLDV